MVVTVLVFLVARLGMQPLRARYMDPLTAPLSSAKGGPNAAAGGWIIDSGLLDAKGHAVFEPQLRALCGQPTGEINAACVRANGIILRVLYQPANRFWAFQGIEAAIFGGLSVLLLGVAVWYVRRRMR